MLDMIVYFLGSSQLHNLGKFGLFLVASSKWQIWTHWHLLPSQQVVFGSFLCLALSDGCFQCEALLLQVILESIAIDESFDDLVTYVFVYTTLCKNYMFWLVHVGT